MRSFFLCIGGIEEVLSLLLFQTPNNLGLMFITYFIFF